MPAAFGMLVANKTITDIISTRTVFVFVYERETIIMMKQRKVIQLWLQMQPRVCPRAHETSDMTDISQIWAWQGSWCIKILICFRKSVLLSSYIYIHTTIANLTESVEIYCTDFLFSLLSPLRRDPWCLGFLWTFIGAADRFPGHGADWRQ